MQVIDEIKSERARQISKGWTKEHDDTLNLGQLAVAAAAYATGISELYPTGWQYKEAPRRKQLIKAAAMLVAEIERLDREEQNKKVSDEGLDDMVARMPKDSNIALTLALAELKERRTAEKEQARAAEAAAN